MAFLGKEALLKPSDLKRETVQVGPLGGEVILRELSVVERFRVLKRFDITDEEDPAQAMRAVLAMVVVSLCNDDGSPMFSDDEVEEGVNGLEQHSSAAVEELMTACQRLQGLDKDATERAVGNSDASPSDSSSSGSPEISDSPPPEH